MHLTNPHKQLLVLLLIGLFSSSLYAQEEKSDCLIKLDQAQTKFNQGRIQDVKPLIIDCLSKNDFNKADKANALKLLTLSYLFLEEPDKAEGTMLNLLKTSHEFAINKAIDPSEFINLYNKFRHEPVFSIGILGGLLVASPIVTDLNGTADLNGKRQSYAPQIGFRGVLNFEYKLFEKFYVNGGISITRLSFKKTHETEKIVSGDIVEGFEGVEKQTILEIPLLAQYHLFEKNKFTLFAATGISPQFLLNASYPGDGITNAIEGSPTVTSQTIDLQKSDRTSINLSAVVIAGIKIKWKEGFFTTQLRYSHGITKATKSNELYPEDPNLLWDLNDSYDGFRLQGLGISLGYTFHIFIPKKLK